MGVQYRCRNEKRRNLLLSTLGDDNKPKLNGIDYLEVLDKDAPFLSPQRTLLVHCFKTVAGITGENIKISGGVRPDPRINPVKVLWALQASNQDDQRFTAVERNFFSRLPEAENILVVRTDSSGDFSTYLLSVVGSSTEDTHFDPQLSQVEFSFKVECPSDFDCISVKVCPPEKLPEPVIDYLSKDYASFRRLMLDRLSIVMPDWKERNPADFGIALVEVLAYAADHLSYYQDAVATEAYLGTARKRISLRRHARLLDYAMHDGCNARAWVQVLVNADGVNLEKDETQFLTQLDGFNDSITWGSDDHRKALNQKPLVFEPLHESVLYASHNEIRFYTWSDEHCCLPRGATRATLCDPENRLRLRSGDVLIFEEVIGPESGRSEDADQTHKHTVRLKSVDPQASLVIDNIEKKILKPGDLKKDPLTEEAIVEIEWHDEDALPFPLCISTVIGREPKDVSKARGNIVLADHGQTKELEVPEGDMFRPRFSLKGPTYRVLYDDKEARSKPAKEAIMQDPKAALPAIFPNLDGEEWTARRDLLNSGRFDPDFIVEMEEDGSAYLRFGDEILGKRPPEGSNLKSIYRFRLGNGRIGNVGADTIKHVVSAESGVIIKARNPLPAEGGTDPEPLEQVRQFAPQAFRKQERAVTEEDYAEVAQRYPGIQRAVATQRWTGSWYTMFITVDRKGGKEVDAEFKTRLRNFLERFRMAGYDMEIDGPRYVPLDIALTVCVAPGYFRSNVKEALLETFCNVDLPDGRRGFFHPDNFTFGQPVYLSKVIADAMKVPGVLWVDADDKYPKLNRFQRWGLQSYGELAEGKISMGRLEIARLDNDPSNPENGKIDFYMTGGL